MSLSMSRKKAVNYLFYLCPRTNMIRVVEWQGNSPLADSCTFLQVQYFCQRRTALLFFSTLRTSLMITFVLVLLGWIEFPLIFLHYSHINTDIRWNWISICCGSFPIKSLLLSSWSPSSIFIRLLSTSFSRT